MVQGHNAGLINVNRTLNRQIIQHKVPMHWILFNITGYCVQMQMIKTFLCGFPATDLRLQTVTGKIGNIHRLRFSSFIVKTFDISMHTLDWSLSKTLKRNFIYKANYQSN